MTFVYILPFVIAGPSVAKPKLISTLKDQFTLRVLAPDSKGKINLKHSDPLIAELPELEKPGFTVYPETALANTDATVFSLENNKLILGSYTAALTPSDTNIYGGFRSFVFASDVETEPVNFTATKASDSYGKSFLRLGSDDGKSVTEDHVIEPKCRLSYFIIKRGFFLILIP